MKPDRASDPALLTHYEGLVRKTSSMCVTGGINGKDFEDICQIFRVKVWKALLAWDPHHPRVMKRRLEGKTEAELRDSFVYGAIQNQKKDLFKRNPERMLLVEDVVTDEPARDKFIFRYLKADHQQVFGHLDESDPLVPNTLNHDERRVLACLYLGHNGPQTSVKLGLSRSQVAAAVRGIREKMEDWKPGAGDPEPEPSELHPTPVLQG